MKLKLVIANSQKKCSELKRGNNEFLYKKTLLNKLFTLF